MSRQRVVVRRSLFDVLSAAQRVTIVSAPAGAGKSVLLRSWIVDAELGGRTAWVSVEREERVLYVSELIGPDVVNTMPEQTLRAFADHGEVRRTLDADPAAAERTLAEARGAGIDLAAVTAELEREGLRSFCDSYHELLECIESQLGIVGGVGG